MIEIFYKIAIGIVIIILPIIWIVIWVIILINDGSNAIENELNPYFDLLIPYQLAILFSLTVAFLMLYKMMNKYYNFEFKIQKRSFIFFFVTESFNNLIQIIVRLTRYSSIIPNYVW